MGKIPPKVIKMPDITAKTDQIERTSPADDQLPVLLLTDRVDPLPQGQLRQLWRRRLLAAAAFGAIATILLEQPPRYYRGEHLGSDIFTFTIAPVPLLGGIRGGAILLLCLIAATVVLWPRR